MVTLIVRRPWSCWSRPLNQISNHVFLYSRFIFPDKFDDTVGCKQQIFRSSFTCSYSLPLLSLEEVEASKCSALIFSVCVKVCANSGRSSRPIEELALTRDWWTLMTLGSGNPPRQGDIFSCHSPAPDQTRGPNPSYLREQSCEIQDSYGLWWLSDSSTLLRSEIFLWNTEAQMTLAFLPLPPSWKPH